ncbi:unnamed protein product [Ambrosiozyma monospora]|uniref:Unnamed protein product n=1 Tax=Ambrosiozyma monospora TaxID=43982 RepID=A0A9W6Z1Y2_AMBMO|nr:unnamed protein product [Ambrosiozyma monospora]
MKLRIATLQLNPIIGQVEENIKRALTILDESLKPPFPDIILLPELAITGYNFANPQQVAPYLEEQGKGKTYDLGNFISTKYNCHTVLGYPEKKDSLIYNSAYCISPTGSIIHNYRKSFLYKTDEDWGCSESPSGFTNFNVTIQNRVFKTAIGICMDLNPYKFTAPFEKYEFANYCYSNEVELVLVPTAWMNHAWKDDWKQEDVDHYTKLYEPEEPFEYNIDLKEKNILILTQYTPPTYTRSYPDSETAVYWILRFAPFHANKFTKPKVVAICNRSGIEGRAMYAGSSSIYRYNGRAFPELIDVNVFGSLGQGNEGILVRDVDV